MTDNLKRIHADKYNFSLSGTTDKGSLIDKSHNELGPRKKRKTADNKPNTSYNLVPGKEPSDADTSTGSAANLQLANTWLQECLSRHIACNVRGSGTKPTPSPTRLVDIREPSRPLLMETNSRSNYAYVALSYCWGHGKKVITVKSNYQSYLRGLPTTDMPRTFADSIKVAKALNYDYIWIDAFCIIQDDRNDLNRELPIMGDIYRYADFTIYTAGGSSSHAGAFRQRDPRAYRPCQLSASFITDKGEVHQDITLATAIEGPDYLDPRGWVLQERILSSRCLIFGRQMTWSCSEAEAKETNPMMRPSRISKTRFSPAEFRSLVYRHPRAYPSGTTTAVPFRSWYNLVEHYSDKLLTVSSDNLNAVSGLAAMFRETFDIHYVAGLWTEQLHTGLAWYVASNDERPVTKDNEGPSWSWAAVGKVRISYRHWQATKEMPAFSNCAQVTDTSHEFVDSVNPYGSLRNATITLKTCVRKFQLHSSKTYADARTELSYGSYVHGQTHSGLEVADARERPRFPAFITDDTTKEVVAEVALDMPLEEMACFARLPSPTVEVLDCWCALLHVENTRQSSCGTLLVMEAVDGDRFKRIGLGFFSGESLDCLLSSEQIKTILLL